MAQLRGLPGSAWDGPWGRRAGLALGQQGNTGQFSAASVSGQSYVFGAQGSDANGVLLAVNTHGAESLGRTADEMVGQNLTKVIPEDRRGGRHGS